MELGIAMKQRGRRVAVITNATLEEQVNDAGVDFVAMETSLIANPRLWHPTKLFARIVERTIVPNIERLYQINHERHPPENDRSRVRPVLQCLDCT